MHYPNKPQCPQPEEKRNDESNTSTHRQPQRCHNRMSPSQFRSRFATEPIPIPLEHQQQFANALTTSHPVWEKPSTPTQSLVWRLQPFQLESTVKKPSSH